jgi:putative oxidoreductase
MKAPGPSSLGRVADLGPLFLRVGAGTVFAWHGWQKFDAGVSGYAGFLDSLHVPAPEVVAWLQVGAEGIGGLLLIAGLFTRFAVLPLIAVMVGAIWLVKADVGFIVADAAGAELETVLLAGLLGLLFMGPGRLSLDAILGMETSAQHLDTGQRRPPVAA